MIEDGIDPGRESDRTFTPLQYSWVRLGVLADVGVAGISPESNRPSGIGRTEEDTKRVALPADNRGALNREGRSMPHMPVAGTRGYAEALAVRERVLREAGYVRNKDQSHWFDANPSVGEVRIADKKTYLLAGPRRVAEASFDPATAKMRRMISRVEDSYVALTSGDASHVRDDFSLTASDAVRVFRWRHVSSRPNGRTVTWDRTVVEDERTGALIGFEDK